jgi:hypothetical protein
MILKDDQLCKSDDSMFGQGGFMRGLVIQMPIPNHKHCGVCRVNYEDYNSHVSSAEHKS